MVNLLLLTNTKELKPMANSGPYYMLTVPFDQTMTLASLIWGMVGR